MVLWLSAVARLQLQYPWSDVTFAFEDVFTMVYAGNTSYIEVNYKMLIVSLEYNRSLPQHLIEAYDDST
jgi:hypothetical protein